MRLIDVDRLIKELNDKGVPIIVEINDIILNQPTAFDVEKVVNELVEADGRYCDHCGGGLDCTTVVEIIKGEAYGFKKGIEGMPNKTKGEMTRSEIIKAIKTYIKTHGYSPTIQEIGEMVGLKSKSSVFNHLVILREEGRIETDNGFNPRTIRVPGMKITFEGEADDN